MHIGFIVRDYPVASQTFVSQKVRWLEDQGHRVTIYCRRYHRALDESKRSQVKALYSLWGFLAVLWGVFIFPLFLIKNTHKVGELLSLFNLLKFKSKKELLSIPNVFRLLNKSFDVIHIHFARS